MNLRLRREPKTRLTAEGFFAQSKWARSRERGGSGAQILCREPNKAPDKEFLCRVQFFAPSKEIFKNHFFTSNFFLSSTYTYTKLMLKFDIISALFAIFKNLLLSSIFSYTSDM
jgi:hypothetical protein